MQLLHSRLSRIVIGGLSGFLILGTVSAWHYYNQYATIIDRKLSQDVFQQTAKLYAERPEELLTSLAEESGVKRHLVGYEDIPKVLVDAVTAGEDRTFFSHHGVAPFRIAGALIADFKHPERLQGGSTITQQLARSFFLTREQTLRRKFSEAFFALILESRLSKQQILTMYANEVYLGQWDSFAIHGFAEASVAEFGKSLAELTLPEAATLAGLVPAPNAYSPRKHPDRAIARRNLILRAMRDQGAITQAEFEDARQAGLHVAPSRLDETGASYFVDFVHEELAKDYPEPELMNGGLNVYTTIDMGLQKAAVEAVTTGLTQVEQALAKANKAKRSDPSAHPQAGLIALNPHTGAILAMVGGTDYGTSQLNRMTKAFRQPGSVFKPFVYAAALETPFETTQTMSAELGDPMGMQLLEDAVVTPLSAVVDVPTGFLHNGKVYTPSNYGHDYHGLVTIRGAFERSLNVATIRVAERVGYDRVAALAKRIGLNSKIKGYPSIGVGAFEVTPIALAGAYTAFANGGQHVVPHAIRRIIDAHGIEVKTHHYRSVQILHPEVAYLVTHLMEGVINHGTGAGVRARGFTLPAAGKTGTSRDGWFAGYTRDLLVIAWVGFDDNRDLNLEGARSALPIWTEFMKKAYALRPPRDLSEMGFKPPSGIEFARIDADTLLLATPNCEHTFEEAFIAGTAPTTYCPRHQVSD